MMKEMSMKHGEMKNESHAVKSFMKAVSVVVQESSRLRSDQ